MTYNELKTIGYGHLRPTVEEVLVAKRLKTPTASATTATREFAATIQIRPGESDADYRLRLADEAWRIGPKIRAEFGNDRVRYDAYNNALIAGKVKIRGRAA